MIRMQALRKTRIPVIALATALLAACGAGGGEDQADVLARRAELTTLSSGYSEVTINDLRTDPAAMQLAGG